MERTLIVSKLFSRFSVVIFISGFAAHASNVVMAPPPEPAALPGAGETYAESSFGSKNRAPAGLEFSGQNSKAAGPLITHELSAKSDDPAGDRGANTRLDTAPVKAPELDRGSIRRKGVQEISLIAGDLGFFPKTIFVTPDIPVRLFITGASKNSLCLMMDSFQVRKQVRSQKIEEIMFTPTTAGRYRFYCPVNGTEGTLVVREIASPLAAAQ